MDHADHTPLAADEINESDLAGVVIYGPNNEPIGTVAHVHGMGATMQVVVIVAMGGFLGTASRSVALDVNKLDFMRDEDGEVHATTSLTKDQVTDLPEHHH